jgi:hypothetical protein
MIGLTGMGVISVPVRNLPKGKEPQDMSEPGFWGRAFTQGGGAGIFGDFVFWDPRSREHQKTPKSFGG